MAIGEMIGGTLVVFPESLKDAIYALEDAARRGGPKGSLSDPAVSAARSALTAQIGAFAGGYASWIPDALDGTAGDVRQAQALLSEVSQLIERAEGKVQRAQGGQRGMALHV